MNPHEWIVDQRRREDRRNAVMAFVGIAVLLVLLIGGGMLTVAYVEGKF